MATVGELLALHLPGGLESESVDDAVRVLLRHATNGCLADPKRDANVAGSVSHEQRRRAGIVPTYPSKEKQGS